MSESLVSIIMPSYNSEKYIAHAIESVLIQDYQNWELLIVDDFSKDKTRDIIKEYAHNDKRIKYHFLEKNSGAANARNIAVSKAKGKFIAFLDSDDLWRQNKLIIQIPFMESNDFHFTSTSYDKIDEQGFDLDKIIKTKSKSDYWELLKTCPGNSTVVYNAKKLGKFYIPLIKKRNDYVMWLEIIKKSKYLYGLEEVLGSHRIVSTGLSNNKFDLVKYHWKVYREIEELSLVKSIYLIIYWIMMTVLKLR